MTETQRLISAGVWTDAFDVFDGLGHAAVHSAANGESVPWDRTDICYDGEGRTSFESYPYQTSAAASAPNCSGTGDSFQYDALSRPTLTTHSDGSTFITNYAGRATETEDEGNGASPVMKVTQVNGLGHLASVCEVTSATQQGADGTPAACPQDIGSTTGFFTRYRHDPLGNLLEVRQGGAQQPRVFQYDGLSRLLSASNPESGVTTYTYDADSNVLTRTRPAANQNDPAVTTTTGYGWDALNRLQSKTYSDGVTPGVNYGYDQRSGLGFSPLQNPVGRLIWETAGNAGAVFSYDAMGRAVYDAQFSPTHAGAYYPVSYAFDLAGDRIQESDNTAYQNGGQGTRVAVFNRALRLTAYTSTLAQSPAQLLSGVRYNAFGEPLGDTLGNGAAESYAYDHRGRERSRAAVNAAGAALYGLALGYAGDGDVIAAADSVNGTWSYGFDELNRLQTAVCAVQCPWGTPAGGAVEWSMDRYGNRWGQTDAEGNPTASGAQLGFSGAGNRADAASGVSYDAAGDITEESGTVYQWDAEGRLTGIGGAAGYLYDAEGRRAAADGIDYVFDWAGRWRTMVAWAPGPVASWGEEYAAGRHLATTGGGTTHFIHGDELGSLRASSGMDGNLFEQATNLPFGDALVETGADWSPLHFTGKSRDADTGLDYFGARYYSSQLGRFLTPDWSDDPEPIPYADLENPQSLNLYAYASNNPVSATDPDGHCPFCWLAPLFAGAGTGATEGAEIGATAGTVAEPGGGTLAGAGVGALAGATVGFAAAAAAETYSLLAGSGDAASPQPAIVGNNAKGSSDRTNSDLPGGHDEAKADYGAITKGQTITVEPDTGHLVSSDKTRLRLNPDGTARIDMPKDGVTNPETIHYNPGDSKIQSCKPGPGCGQ